MIQACLLYGGDPLSGCETRLESYNRKVRLLRSMLANRQADSLCLSSQAATSWLTGARSYINVAAEAACFKVVVTADEVYMLVNNIEADRLKDEELDGLPIEVRPYSWFTTEETPEGALPEAAISDWLRSQQFVLDPYEQGLLRQLSFEVGASVAEVMKSFDPGIREMDLAARLHEALMSRGIEPVVTLVAGDDRTKLRRHPLPTHNRIQRYALAAVCGRRQGLIASVTRSVSFNPLSADLARRHDASAAVDAIAISNTKSGRTLGFVLDQIQQGYADCGFAGEWKLHHQGGITGYYTRALLAKPKSTVALEAGMAIAWNPSVAGTKTEDTCLVGDEGATILTLSSDDWPTKLHQTSSGVVERPSILVR